MNTVEGWLEQGGSTSTSGTGQEGQVKKPRNLNKFLPDYLGKIYKFFFFKKGNFF